MGLQLRGWDDPGRHLGAGNGVGVPPGGPALSSLFCRLSLARWLQRWRVPTRRAGEKGFCKKKGWCRARETSFNLTDTSPAVTGALVPACKFREDSARLLCWEGHGKGFSGVVFLAYARQTVPLAVVGVGSGAPRSPHGIACPPGRGLLARARLLRFIPCLCSNFLYIKAVRGDGDSV